MTTRAGGSGSGAVSGDEEFIDPRIVDVISAEVSRAILDAIPEMFSRIKDEVLAMMDERMAAAVAAGTDDIRQRLAAVEARGGDQPRARTVTYRDFSACQPPVFEGLRDPLVSQRWVAEVEGAFRTSFCPDESRVRFAVNLLRGAAKDWWELVTQQLTEAEVTTMTWDVFLTRFRDEYVL